MQPKSIIPEIIKKISINKFQHPCGKCFTHNMRGRVWGYIRPFFNERPGEFTPVI